MHHKNIKFAVIIAAGLVANNMSFAEGPVYLKSTEPCLVEVYSAPDTAALAEKLNCGEKVTVLVRRGPLVRIQTSTDKVVWVAAKETTVAAPAELEVKRLEAQQKIIEGELVALNEKVKTLSETSEKLINALIAAEVGKKK